MKKEAKYRPGLLLACEAAVLDLKRSHRLLAIGLIAGGVARPAKRDVTPRTVPLSPAAVTRGLGKTPQSSSESEMSQNACEAGALGRLLLGNGQFHLQLWQLRSELSRQRKTALILLHG